MYRNKKIISLVISASICLTPVSNAFAKTFDARTGVALDKSWTIHFSNQLSSNEDFSKVTIKDSNGNIIPITVSIGTDKKSIVVKPNQNYSSSTTYTLTVDGVKDVNNTNEKEITEMQFTTIASQSPQPGGQTGGQIGGGSTTPIDNPNTQLVIAQPKGPGINVYSGIKTLYGDHDYGCKSQAEYDAVIAKVKQAIDEVNEKKTSNYYAMLYDQGERSHYSTSSEIMSAYRNGQITLQQYKDEKGLFQIQKTMGEFLDSTSKEYHNSILNAIGIGGDFDTYTQHENPNATSAYDVIVNHISKCDADAQTQSVVLDMLGYNTAVIGGGGDAKCKVQVSNQWWDVDGLFKCDLNGDWVSAPTYD